MLHVKHPVRAAAIMVTEPVILCPGGTKPKIAWKVTIVIWRRGGRRRSLRCIMARTTNLSRPIVEALYTEALVLADEVRAVFAAGTREPVAGEDAYVRLALSTEGLKTTTRMMHVLAWLLNQRALFQGELSENQVRLHGALPPDRGSDEGQLALLEPETRELIADTERLHQRIARLDEAWRQHFEMTSPVRAFQDRIGREFGRTA